MASTKKPLFPPVYAPTVSHPLVDDFTLRAARLRQGQQPPIPTSYQIPLRNHPLWSGNNELGIEQPYQPDGNGLQTILKLGEWGEPRMWTIALGIVYNPALIPGGGDGQFSIDGLIRFGSGGVTQDIDVDWGEGVSLTVPMNAVNVIARYSETTFKSNTPPDLRLRVNLAPGELSQQNATKSTLLTVETGALNAVTSVIPKFARRLEVARGFGTAPAGAWDANMSYDFRGAPTTGDLGGFTGAEYLANFGGRGVPIPAPARFIRVANVTGSTEFVRLIYTLAF